MAVMDLTATERAAAVLISLGAEVAASIYKCLDEEDIELLSYEISKLDFVPDEDMKAIVEDFYGLCLTKKVLAEGGVGYARDVLEKAFGPQMAISYMERVNKSLKAQEFEFLRKMDFKNLVSMLQNEHPQTIALVMSYSDPAQCSQVLAELPKEKRIDVVERIAKIDRANGETLKLVEQILFRKAEAMAGNESMELGGVVFVANIMKGVDRGVEKHIFDELGIKDPSLLEAIRKQMFVFEDIAGLDDQTVQRFIRDVDTKDLAVALKQTKPEVYDIIMRSMSSRMAESVKTDMEYLTSVRMRDVEDAQQRIVNVIRKLESEGVIVIGGKDDIIV